MVEPFVPIEDVAKHFAVSISTIRAWLRAGHIPQNTYVKIGNTYRFKLPAVAAALLTTPAIRDSDPNQLEFDFDTQEDDNDK